MTHTATAALEAIRRDPVSFCRTVLRFEPWSKQAAILESVRDNPRTAVRSAHGVGKTSTAARAVLWFLAAYPYSRVITTAPTFSQVRELLWREIAVGHAAADGFFDGALFDTRLELGPDWFALGLNTDRPERFSGHHAQHLLLLVGADGGQFLRPGGVRFDARSTRARDRRGEPHRRSSHRSTPRGTTFAPFGAPIGAPSVTQNPC